MPKTLIILCLFILGKSETTSFQTRKSETISFQTSKTLRIKYIKDLNIFIDTTKIKANKNEISDINSSISESCKDLSYELLIDDYHSIFKVNKSLVSDKNDISFRKLASSIGGTKGVFYINKADSIYLNKKEYAGEDFRVKLNTKNWKITNETKEINSFKCYKATSIESITNTKGTFKFNVTAWFTPELPSFFGPAGYFGLPGLILKLDNGKITLKATEINFDNSSKTKIKPLKKGVLVTKEEFDRLVNNTARDRLKSLFKN